MINTMLKSKPFRYSIVLLGSAAGLCLLTLIYPTLQRPAYNGFNILLLREQFIAYEAFILLFFQLAVYRLLKDKRTTWYPLLAYPNLYQKKSDSPDCYNANHNFRKLFALHDSDKPRPYLSLDAVCNSFYFLFIRELWNCRWLS